VLFQLDLVIDNVLLPTFGSGPKGKFTNDIVGEIIIDCFLPQSREGAKVTRGELIICERMA
jgi:hypothetical protein